MTMYRTAFRLVTRVLGARQHQAIGVERTEDVPDQESWRVRYVSDVRDPKDS